jgi:hypothetical protein
MCVPLGGALQPLTPALHLSDMRGAVPGYTEMVARALKASLLTLDDLRAFYARFEQPNPSLPTRLLHLQQGVPYMLRR